MTASLPSWYLIFVSALSNSTLNVLLNKQFSMTYGQQGLDVFSYLCTASQSHVINCRWWLVGNISYLEKRWIFRCREENKNWDLDLQLIVSSDHLIYRSFFVTKNVGKEKKVQKQWTELIDLRDGEEVQEEELVEKTSINLSAVNEMRCNVCRDLNNFILRKDGRLWCSQELYWV